jgi:hypothetical protein
LWPGLSRAQSIEENPWFVRAGITPSFILPNNPFPTTNNVESVPRGSDVTIEAGRQTDGSEKWHELYGMPSYGVGLSIASFGNDVQRIRPIEVYTFFSWPFARINERLDVTTDFGMGLSWNWQEALGSNVNARIDWGFFARYLTTPKTNLYMGVDFTHRSNGGTVEPNRGINVIGPKVALRYNFASDEPPMPSGDRPPFERAWEFVAGGAAGVKNAIEQRDPIVRQDFGALDATAAVQYHFYRFGKVAGGTDVTYDGSKGARLDADNQEVRADVGQRWALGLYGGYEHLIGRLSALVQMGSIVARGFDDPETPRLYARYGWRFQINDRYWATFSIRARDGRDADALEFGGGYRIPISRPLSPDKE